MSETNGVPLPTLKAKDFTTDQDVRWCPGCGDYAVLAAVRKTLPTLGKAKRTMSSFRESDARLAFRITWRPTACTPFMDVRRHLPPGIKIANPTLDVCWSPVTVICSPSAAITRSTSCVAMSM